MRIDAHQHFWRYNPTDYVWMSDEMEILRKDHLPHDLAPLLESAEFDGSIAVQARQTLEETEFLLQLAEEHDWIRGVVGWVDLQSPDVRTQLEKYAQHPKLVGVRHVVHDEPDDQFMLLPEFQRGIAALSEFHLTYDLLLFPKHLPIAVQLVEKFPEQPFVLDHIAKPKIADRLLAPWDADLGALAHFDNVSCKLSGMVTETTWDDWKPGDFHQYLDLVIDMFGIDRVMLGSDWPVCTLAGSYADVVAIVIDYLDRFDASTRNQVLGTNCERFYGVF